MRARRPSVGRMADLVVEDWHTECGACGYGAGGWIESPLAGGNPILSPEAWAALPNAPAFPEPDGRIKTSAAWLIERAGFHRGYGDGRAGISSKHTLALVNRGEATTADLMALAREIAAGVQAVFGIALVPEPVLVGHTW